MTFYYSYLYIKQENFPTASTCYILIISNTHKGNPHDFVGRTPEYREGSDVFVVIGGAYAAQHLAAGPRDKNI